MRAVTHNAKDARIDLRVNLSEKILLEKAANVQGKRLSEFVITASTEAAQQTLADQNRFLLPQDKMEIFLSKLEEEPKALPELKELFKRKSVFE